MQARSTPMTEIDRWDCSLSVDNKLADGGDSSVMEVEVQTRGRTPQGTCFALETRRSSDSCLVRKNEKRERQWWLWWGETQRVNFCYSGGQEWMFIHQGGSTKGSPFGESCPMLMPWQGKDEAGGNETLPLVQAEVPGPVRIGDITEEAEGKTDIVRLGRDCWMTEGEDGVVG
eukprot:scaffold703_cov168-Amphora_coffeaeformis.AAC.15